MRMKISTVNNQNFKGRVACVCLGQKQTKVYNDVLTLFQRKMIKSRYNLFVGQDRKWPNKHFSKQVRFSLWDPYSRHKLPIDSIEVFVHEKDVWIKKLDELINKNA